MDAEEGFRTTLSMLTAFHGTKRAPYPFQCTTTLCCSQQVLHVYCRSYTVYVITVWSLHIVEVQIIVIYDILLGTFRDYSTLSYGSKVPPIL